jgi:hypothetical protein
MVEIVRPFSRRGACNARNTCSARQNRTTLGIRNVRNARNTRGTNLGGLTQASRSGDSQYHV